MSREIYEALSKETLFVLSKEMGLDVYDHMPKEVLVEALLVEESMYRGFHRRRPISGSGLPTYVPKDVGADIPCRIGYDPEQEKTRKALQELVLTLDQGRLRDQSMRNVIMEGIRNMQNSLSQIYTTLSNRDN